MPAVFISYCYLWNNGGWEGTPGRADDMSVGQQHWILAWLVKKFSGLNQETRADFSTHDVLDARHSRTSLQASLEPGKRLVTVSAEDSLEPTRNVAPLQLNLTAFTFK